MPTKIVHFPDEVTDHADHVQNMTETLNTNQKDKPDMTTISQTKTHTTRSGRTVRPAGRLVEQ